MARKASGAPKAVAGDLAEYNRKRDFKKTNEPAGGGLKSAGGMGLLLAACPAWLRPMSLCWAAALPD